MQEGGRGERKREMEDIHYDLKHHSEEVALHVCVRTAATSHSLSCAQLCIISRPLPSASKCTKWCTMSLCACVLCVYIYACMAGAPQTLTDEAYPIEMVHRRTYTRPFVGPWDKRLYSLIITFCCPPPPPPQQSPCLPLNHLLFCHHIN